MNEISGLANAKQVTIPQSEPFIVVKEEWSLVEPSTINVIGGEDVLVGQDTEKKLLHAKALLTKERKPVIVLIDTGSSRNILQKGCCKKHGLVVQPCKKELTGFNVSTSRVLGLVNVLVNIGKCSSVLSFYVLEYGTHPIIEYPGLKKLRLSVNYVLESLVGEDGDRVLCNVAKMGNKVLFKEKNVRQEKQNDEKSVWAHITLSRDVVGVNVAQKEDRLPLPLTSPVVLEPKECIMIVPPFKLSGTGIQNIPSVC